MNKRKWKWILFIVFCIGIIAYVLYMENTSLVVSQYEIKDVNIPASFNGYKIAQVSDFHNTSSKFLRKQVVDELKKQTPDIIVITGDFVDSRRTNIEIVDDFLKEIESIAPIYYVVGNHESRILEYLDLKKVLKKRNVMHLENESVILTKGNDEVVLSGVNDPDMLHEEDVSDEILM